MTAACLPSPPALREDAVVAAIAALTASTAHPRVVLGIGDDAALWQPSRSHRSAISSDAFVEGVHFARALMTFEDLGWRAMAAAVSDLAAMGARPVLATIALGIPTAEHVAIEQLYRGLAAAAAAYGLAIVGGDLTRAPVVFLAVSVVGEVRSSNATRRAGGHPGAVLAVTGPLGAARAGLEVAGNASLRELPSADAALAAFRRPQARCAEGRFLAASRNVEAMMDVSDGLSTDLVRLCRASDCGAAIERVPVAPSARAIAAAQGSDADAFALGGGEDFELLVAVRPRAFDYLAGRFRARFGRPLLRIGTLRAPGEGLTVLRDGRCEPLLASGWDHFAP